MDAPARNFQRGALRLWLVVSAVWVLGMGYAQFHGTQKSEQQNISITLSDRTGFHVDTDGPTQDADVGLCDEQFDERGAPRKLTALLYRSKQDCVAALSAQHQKYVKDRLGRLAPVILPPLLLLLAFPAMNWVRRGFKPAAN